MLRDKDGIYKKYEHYEVYVLGVFKCSADSYSEAQSDYDYYISLMR